MATVANFIRQTGAAPSCHTYSANLADGLQLADQLAVDRGLLLELAGMAIEAQLKSGERPLADIETCERAYQYALTAHAGADAEAINGNLLDCWAAAAEQDRRINELMIENAQQRAELDQLTQAVKAQVCNLRASADSAA